jgi:hypothetical protein
MGKFQLYRVLVFSSAPLGIPNRTILPYGSVALSGLIIIGDSPICFCLFLNRHSGFTQADIKQTSDQICKVAASDQRPLLIFGDYALWFADPSHDNFANLRTANRASLATMAVCRDETQKNYLSCDQIGQLVKLVPVSIADLPASKVKLFLTETTVPTQR